MTEKRIAVRKDYWTPERLAEMHAQQAERRRLLDIALTRRSGYRSNGSYVVYRAFTGEGELLYVGATRAFESRMAYHRGQTGWWLPQVDERRTHVEEYSTAAEASARELELIAELQPPRNRAGVTTHAVPYPHRDERYR